MGATRNIGIVKKIQLTRLDNLLYIPKGTTILLTDIQMQTGSSFVNIDFDKSSASYSENEELTTAGLLYTNTIRFSVSKNNAENVAAIDAWISGKLAALITDTNGETYLVYPLRLKRNRTIPSDVTDPNRIDVTLTGKSMYSSSFVTI